MCPKLNPHLNLLQKSKSEGEVVDFLELRLYAGDRVSVWLWHRGAPSASAPGQKDTSRLPPSSPKSPTASREPSNKGWLCLAEAKGGVNRGLQVDNFSS